jgi:hypothetical protein
MTYGGLPERDRAGAGDVEQYQALRGRVNTVGTAFILVAVLAAVANLGLLFLGHVLRGATPASPPPGMTRDQQLSWELGRESAPLIEFVGVGGISLAVYLPIFIAGLRIQQGRRWGLGVTAAILAMLPCSPGWLLGLPVGIWALVVLCREDVKKVVFQIP